MDFEPDQEEVLMVDEAVKEFISKLSKELKDAEPSLGGSGAKGTWLSGTKDLDVYVKFNYKKYKARSDELSDLVEPVLKKLFGKVVRLHGSRDYFQTNFRGFMFEIIPILAISKASDAVNITDVSQLHVAYVRKNKQYTDDIRKMKQFCKAAGVYGAESYIQGFSGYVLELITIYYKGFENAVKNIAKWKEKVVLGSKEEAAKLNWAKKVSPLIVVDPVQDERNAAAALSVEKFEKLVESCKKYLKSKSEEFFVVKEFSLDEISKRVRGKRKLVVLEVDAKRGKEDVVGAKLRKAYDFIVADAIRKEFKVYDSGWYWNGQVLFWFIVGDEILSEEIIRKGPPVKAEGRVKDFVKKHKGAYKKGKYYYARVKRKVRTFEDFIDFVKDKENVKERVKGMKVRE